MGILERVERIHRAHGNIKTICKKCDQVETLKFYDEDNLSLPKGSFTTKCGCGVWVYRFFNVMINPDPNNNQSYFTKAFSPANHFDPEYKNKDFFEKNGFKKNKNGKYIR